MFKQLIQRIAHPVNTPIFAPTDGPAPVFTSPFTAEPDTFLRTTPPPQVPLSQFRPGASAFGPRRTSSMSTCAKHQPGNLKKLFRAVHNNDFDGAVDLITGEPHLLYCKAGSKSALDDAIDCDSPLAALMLARTVAGEGTEGRGRLQRILRHAIRESHRTQHCNLLASLLQALWISHGNSWVEDRVPSASCGMPVQQAMRAMRLAALEELAPADLERDDVQDLLAHGAADLVMIGLSRRMAAFDPSLLIQTNLFNRDERVVVALADNVAALEACVLQGVLCNGTKLEGDAELAVVDLMSRGRTVLGAMNQKAGSERTTIQESLANLRDLLDHP